MTMCYINLHLTLTLTLTYGNADLRVLAVSHGYMALFQQALFRQAVFRQALLRAAIAKPNTNPNPNSLTVTPYC